MKHYTQSRMIAPRRGTVLGLLVLFCACALMGGADPAAQIDAARDARAKLEVASSGQMEEGLPTLERPAAVAPEGIDFVDFAEAESKITTRNVDGAERITVALNDVSLEDTVRMFAQTAGANIISSGALLEGKRVTVNLNEVDWQPALRSILEINALSLVEQAGGSGVYTIQAKVPDAPEPTVVQTFFLDYTTVGDIKDSIKGMLGSDAVISLFPSRNAIVIRSTEGNLREVTALIEELDRPGRQVLIEAKIMELSDSAMKELGIRWDSLKEFGINAKISPYSWSQKSTDTRETSRFSDQLSQAYQVDTRRTFRPQEDGQAYPTVENVDFASSANNDFIGRDETGIKTPAYSPGRESFSYGSRGAQDGSSVLDKFTREIVESQSAILDMSSLSVILSALEQMDGVSVVSNPKMIVTSGSTNAFFSVGDRNPIISQELKRGTTESPGDTISAKLDTTIATDFIQGGYLKTGVDLKVIATVKTDDYIEALINPSLRRLKGFKEVTLAENVVNSWPIISLKEINTTFTLHSGQTVAIGGLTDTQDQKVTTRVPFLGRIPILGRLFSHEENSKSQIETIIFVTLSVANPGELQENAGIPDDARLVHNRRLKDQAQKEEFERKLQEQIDAKKALETPTEEAPEINVPVAAKEKSKAKKK